MAIITITPSDGIWSNATINKIRASQAGDIIRLVGRFDLGDQFQLLGGASELDLTEAIINVRPTATNRAGFLIRHDGFVRIMGGEIVYHGAADVNNLDAVFYVRRANGGVEIAGTEIFQLSHTHGIQVYAADGQPIPHCRILGVQIHWKDQSYMQTNHSAVWLRSTIKYAAGTSTANDSTRAGTLPVSDKNLRGILITGLVTDGGYYGISGEGVSPHIRFCQLSNNTRGISLQNDSEASNIEWSTIRENRSAGVHFAYGSGDKDSQELVNTLKSVVVNSSRADGEGLIQAYVGSSVLAKNCHVEASASTSNPTYALYAGAGGALIAQDSSAYVTKARRALVGSEATWDTTISADWHRASNADASQQGLSSHPSTAQSVLRLTDTNFASKEESLIAVLSNVKPVEGAGVGQIEMTRAYHHSPGNNIMVRVGAKVEDTRIATYINSTFIENENYTILRNVTGKVAEAGKEPQWSTGNVTHRGITTDMSKWGFRRPGTAVVPSPPPVTPPAPPPSSGGGGTSPTPPAPPPPVVKPVTIGDITTRQKVLFITRPTDREYGAWVSCMEVENGAIVSYPYQTAFPPTGTSVLAVTVPENGSIPNLANVTTSRVTFYDGSIVANLAGNQGVRWYTIDPAKFPLSREWDPRNNAITDLTLNPEFNEAPQGTVGEITKNGITTILWVQDVSGEQAKGRYVTVQNGKPVALLEHAQSTAQFTFTSPRNIPCVVYPGNRLPADILRYMRRALVEPMPVEGSGHKGEFTFPRARLTNYNTAQFWNGTAFTAINTNSVTEWYEVGGSSGGSSSSTDDGSAGSLILRTVEEKMRAAVRNTQRGHEDTTYFPGWGSLWNADWAPQAQQKGGSIGLGPLRIMRQLNGGRYSSQNGNLSNDHGMFTQDHWNGYLGTSVFTHISPWFGFMRTGLKSDGDSKISNQGSVWVQIRRWGIWLLPPDSDTWERVIFWDGADIHNNMWTGSYSPNMATHPNQLDWGEGTAEQKAARMREYQRQFPDPQKRLDNGITTVECPSFTWDWRMPAPSQGNKQVFVHGGMGHHSIESFWGKYDRARGGYVELEARLHPDSPDDAKVAIQYGLDPICYPIKNALIDPGRRWYAAWGGTRFLTISKEWRTINWVNSNEGLDAGNGGIVISTEDLLKTRF